MQNLELKHLNQASISQTELTIDALSRIAPSCITEVKDSKTGSIKHAVDFHVLRQLLGDSAVEDKAEAYEFTWVGKQEARREAAKSITKTLRPVPEDSVDWDNTQNIYIEGDNLEVLKLLQKSYLGKVKMIYIDPPYNTGNDFVYHDDFKQSQSEYDEAAGNVDEEGNRLLSRNKGGNDSDLEDAFKKNTDSNGRFHSDWCSMIYSRLMIARSLLTEDGVIFISIDDNEVENLRKICDEVFGEANFIATLVWERAYSPKNDAKYISNSHDYILMFAKQIDLFTIGRLERTAEANARYKNPDNDPRGDWKPSDMSVKTYNKACDYAITTPSGKVVEPPAGRCWRLSANAFAERLRDNRIWFGPDGNSVPSIKRFLSELQFDGMAPTSILFYKEVGHSQEGAKEVTALFGDKGVFDGPKPVRLMERLITLANLHNDSIVLDFFSGSATTAHALMKANAESGKSCKFILVQLPEEISDTKKDQGYKNICEIGKERIRRAGAKIKAELEKNEVEDTNKEKGLFDGNENKIENENGNKNESGNEETSAALAKATSLDTGFRVFRIDSGNMKDVEQSPSDIKQTELDWFLDNVKDDRTELDLLFGCMLNWGVQLSLPMSMETVDGCNIYTVNEGDLVACLTKDLPVTENIVRAIAEKSPLRVLFRDGSFASDAAKINIFEQFKQLMDWSDDEIIKNVRVL